MSPAGVASGFDDERLRAALRSAQAGDEPGPACAAPERIFEGARGALPTPEVRALLDHSATCASCALAFRLAREILADAPEAAEPDAAAGRLRRLPLWALAGLPALAAAAALLLAVLQPRGEPAAVRADPAQIASLLPAGPLSREAFTLRWTAGPPGSRYSVTVATPALAQLHARSGLEQPELLVPKAALAAVPAGATVVWQVSALFPDGRRVESPAFLTTVR